MYEQRLQQADENPANEAATQRQEIEAAVQKVFMTRFSNSSQDQATPSGQVQTVQPSNTRGKTRKRNRDSDITCGFCHKVGHMDAECWAKHGMMDKPRAQRLKFSKEARQGVQPSSSEQPPNPTSEPNSTDPAAIFRSRRHS